MPIERQPDQLLSTSRSFRLGNRLRELGTASSSSQKEASISQTGGLESSPHGLLPPKPQLGDAGEPAPGDTANEGSPATVGELQLL